MALKDVYEKAIREDIDLISSLEGYVKTEPEYSGPKYVELEAFVSRLKSEQIFPTKVFGRVQDVRYLPEKKLLEIFFEPRALEKKKRREEVSLKGIRILDPGAGIYLAGSTEPTGEAKVKYLWFYFPRKEEAVEPLFGWKERIAETWACALVGEELVCAKVYKSP